MQWWTAFAPLLVWTVLEALIIIHDPSGWQLRFARAVGLGFGVVTLCLGMALGLPFVVWHLSSRLLRDDPGTASPRVGEDDEGSGASREGLSPGSRQSPRR